MFQFSSVEPLSHVRLFATPWTAARQASLSITNSWSLLKLMPIESVTPYQTHYSSSKPSPLFKSPGEDFPCFVRELCPQSHWNHWARFLLIILPVLKSYHWKKQSCWEERFQGRNGSCNWWRVRGLLFWKWEKRTEIKRENLAKYGENLT